jgi:hypothetical protein
VFYLWNALARHSRQIIAIMHFVHIHQVHAATHLAIVTITGRVAYALAALVPVLEEGCAVALAPASQRKELRAACARAKLIAEPRCHRNSILFYNLVVVVEALLVLRVQDAAHVEVSRGASLLVDHVAVCERVDHAWHWWIPSIVSDIVYCRVVASVGAEHIVQMDLMPQQVIIAA